MNGTTNHRGDFEAAPRNPDPVTPGLVAQLSSNLLLTALLAGTFLLTLVALVWCYGLGNHLAAAEKKLAAAEEQNTVLAVQQQSLNDRFRAATDTLAQSVGLTQKQLAVKTRDLLEAQTAAATAARVQTARLERAQEAATKQIGSVASDVSAVKTDVGGAKASIAATQTDLAETRAQLQRTIGDAGIMSGLIARTHDDLETLRHKGDRSYFEFTLHKGDKPILLASIRLHAKKIDDKHAKYTMMVGADDRTIEKKDKSLDEPVQFYTGKDPVLYELVVNVIAKNTVSGYLSTPRAGGAFKQ